LLFFYKNKWNNRSNMMTLHQPNEITVLDGVKTIWHFPKNIKGQVLITNFVSQLENPLEL